MKFAGHLIGHADGLEEDVLDDSLSAVLSDEGLLDWFEKLEAGLRLLFDRRQEWDGMTDHFALNRLVESIAAHYSLIYQHSEDFAIS